MKLFTKQTLKQPYATVSTYSYRQTLSGATNIDLYIKAVHPNVTRLLEFLSKTDDSIRVLRFEYLPHSERLRTDDPTENLNQKRRNEVLPYNDCFYRNLKSFKFVLPLDFDELMVPRIGRRWEKILKSLEEKVAASYTAMNGYFLDDFHKTDDKVPGKFFLLFKEVSAN